ncbi:GAP family protein [Dactylosporangium sp. AC04546]|uniref:GAP family protein n=1 Tax=Dactylosporangium sp. AC04546 TaxID=2862460 RepID=UPI001EE07C18|nr:GAP family protein [Dactylosporangium sp. AC04546]WVK78377.1 GAP family protein [Dactylosporangium sp. AC04546]
MGLGAAIGGILVPAVGVALSPVPVLAAFQAAGPARTTEAAAPDQAPAGTRRTGTALLDRTRTAASAVAAATAIPRPAGLAYLGAFLVGLAVPAALVVAVAGPAARSAIGLLLILLGIVLLLLAAMEWRRRPLPGHQRRPPQWLAGLATMPLREAALRGGRAAAGDPKNLTLTVAAALLTARAGGSPAMVVLYAVLASLTVAAPMLWSARLTPLGDWFARDHAPILVTTLLLTGTAVLAAGLS